MAVTLILFCPVQAQIPDSTKIDPVPNWENVQLADHEEVFILLQEDELRSNAIKSLTPGLKRLSIRGGAVWNAPSAPAHPAGSTPSVRLAAEFGVPFGIDLNVALEKDAYEPVRWMPHKNWFGPDVTRFTVHRSDPDFSFIAGRYRVRFGNGLITGTDPSGFRSRRSPTGLPASGHNLSPVRGTSELLTPRGLAVSVARFVRISAFVFHQRADASLDTSPESGSVQGEAVFSDFSSGGRHVTTGSLDRRMQASLRGYGVIAEVERKHGSFGVARLVVDSGSPWRNNTPVDRTAWSVSWVLESGVLRIRSECALIMADTRLCDIRSLIKRDHTDFSLVIFHRNGMLATPFSAVGHLFHQTQAERRLASYWRTRLGSMQFAGGMSLRSQEPARGRLPEYRMQAFLFGELRGGNWSLDATMVGSSESIPVETIDPGNMHVPTENKTHRMQTEVNVHWSPADGKEIVLGLETAGIGQYLLHLGSSRTTKHWRFDTGVWMSTNTGTNGRLYGYERTVSEAFGLVGFSSPQARGYVFISRSFGSGFDVQFKYSETVSQAPETPEATPERAPPPVRRLLFQLIYRRGPRR